MLVVAHPQSADNVRIRWGFLTILYKYIIQQIFLPHLRSSEFYKAPLYMPLSRYLADIETVCQRVFELLTR